MIVNFKLTAECECGKTWTGIQTSRVRINKNSLRTVKGDKGLVMLCRPEGCKCDDVGDPTYSLPDDEKKRISEYRKHRWES